MTQTEDFSKGEHIARIDALFANIRDGLTDDRDSASLGKLIADTLAEKERAYAQAGHLRAEANDPRTFPGTARDKLETVEFLENDARRLHAAAEELSKRRAAALAAERDVARRENYAKVKAETEALAAEIVKVYPKAAKAIVDLLVRMKSNEIAVQAVNSDLGGLPWLPNAERRARNVVGPQTDIAGSIRLPPLDAQEAQRALLWPRG